MPSNHISFAFYFSPPLTLCCSLLSSKHVIVFLFSWSSCWLLLVLYGVDGTSWRLYCLLSNLLAERAISCSISFSHSSFLLWQCAKPPGFKDEPSLWGHTTSKACFVNMLWIKHDWEFVKGFVCKSWNKSTSYIVNHNKFKL